MLVETGQSGDEIIKKLFDFSDQLYAVAVTRLSGELTLDGSYNPPSYL
jgi:hypothetical protein